MKKFFATLMCAATLAVTACGPTTITSAQTKAKLEKNEYAVEVWSQSEAKLKILGFNFNVEFVDALFASKTKDLLLAFYCNNSDDAQKMANENIAVLVRYAEQYVEEAKCGNYNNVAYVGSEASVKAAGFKI